MSEELINRLKQQAAMYAGEGYLQAASLLNEAITAIESRPAPAVQVPEGMALVPVEPTPEMERAAGVDGTWCMCCGYDNGPGNPATVYHAMLAAAPAPASSAQKWRELSDPPGVLECLTKHSIDIAPVATEAVAQEWECCGNPVVGAEYMGLQEMVCCDQYEPASEKPVAQGGGVYDLDADRPRAIKTADQLQRLPVVSEAAAMTIDDALTHLTWPEFENDEPRFLYSAARALGDEVVRLRALLSASPAGVGGWIPVSERLPEVGAVVLGFWKNSAGPHSHITGQNYGITARNKHGRWYDASEDDNEDDEWIRPDYWQPLPAAPAIATQGEGE